MFKEEDLQKFLYLKNLIGEAKFDIDGKAVITASACFTWFEQLEIKIRNEIQKEEKKGQKVSGK